MFVISRRKRFGMSAIASATSSSNLARVTLLVPSSADRLRSASDHQPEVVAIAAHGTLIAQRLWLADAAAMQDLHVGGDRPHLSRQRTAQLILDLDRIVPLGDADPVRHAQDVTIHREAWDTESMAEDHVCRLAADARQAGE